MMQRFFQKITPSEPIHAKTLGVLLVSAVSLMVLNYGQQNAVYRLVEPFLNGLFPFLDSGLQRLLWWAFLCFFCYFLLPVFFLLAIGERNLGLYGLGTQGMLQKGRPYVVLLLPMLPLVFLFSFLPSFQLTYPFWRVDSTHALWPGLLIWELAYALQFFSLEFFFRGFMVHGSRGSLGWYSVPVMMVPYLMIHFSKPFPEAFGSLIAGWVLGMLSFHSRSIWWGAVLHIAVAWSMDLLSLWHRGLLG
jgi:membrane protease YdiL (CAAX protease family)